MKSVLIPKSNLHTHTRYCDGADTPSELVSAAIDAGMESLGFSGHAATRFDTEASMSREGTEAYRNEILTLREQYRDQISILLGIEQDFFADEPAIGYDYVIGSVHYLKTAEGFVPIDLSAEALRAFIDRHFGGDPYLLAEAYYETVAQVVEKTGCGIIGHFDLISKFNEGELFFDEQDPRYLRPAIDALDTLLEKDVIFEINTGAMARGYRRTPYPAPLFLHRIAEKRGQVTLSSDAHRKDALLYGFAEAEKIARAAGIGALQIMTRNGWRSFSL